MSPTASRSRPDCRVRSLPHRCHPPVAVQMVLERLVAVVNVDVPLGIGHCQAPPAAGDAGQQPSLHRVVGMRLHRSGAGDGIGHGRYAARPAVVRVS